MNPSEIELFFSPKDRLRMTVGDTSYVTVKPAWAAPLSSPTKYLSLLNGKGEEITLLPDPEALPESSLNAVRQEIRRRYLAASIRSIKHVRAEYGVTYWTVETDRGPRDFVTQSLQENAQWLTSNHLLLVDVDGNRFEISDVAGLDAPSREYIARIV